MKLILDLIIYFNGSRPSKTKKELQIEDRKHFGQHLLHVNIVYILLGRDIKADQS